jgi:predicted transcriptional regulator
MKLKGLVCLSLVLILAFSTASLIQRQKQGQVMLHSVIEDLAAQKITLGNAFYAMVNQLSPQYTCTFLTSASFQINLSERAPLPVNSTRTAIYNFISANPGVQFRAICGGLGLSIGVVQFHLAQLQRCGLITSFRKGRYKRFFVARRFSLREMETIAALRLQTARNILKILLEGKRVSHHQLAMQVSISSQGLTWQMNRLKETGLIAETRDGLNVAYALRQDCVQLVSETASLINA